MKNLESLIGTTMLHSAVTLANMSKHEATINNQLREMPHDVYQNAGELAIALLLFRVQHIARM